MSSSGNCTAIEAAAGSLGCPGLIAPAIPDVESWQVSRLVLAHRTTPGLVVDTRGS